MLVVDDDPLVLRMLTRALAAFEVVSTTEPARALTLLEQPHSFVVVVCDVSMPGLSGPELCARIEVTRPGTANRFLFVTGGAMSPTERDFLNLPHVRWLEKTVRPAELRRAVESMAQAPS